MDYQFHINYLPGLLALLVIYGVMGVSLLKTNIIPLYRKWFKKDKLTVMGSIVVFWAVMLLFASRQEGQPVMDGLVTAQTTASLMWLFHMDVQIHALFAFLIGPFWLVLLMAMIMDLIADKKEWMRLPFCTYVGMFLVGYVFYHPTRYPMASWLVACLVAAFILGFIKMRRQGASGKKKLFIFANLVLAVAIIALEPGIDWRLLGRLLVIFGESILAALTINRASVLRKPLWLLTTLLVYAALFVLHFWTIF